MDMARGAFVHLRRLEDDERISFRRADAGVLIKNHEAVGALFGKYDSQLTIISRPGLFKLIQRSNKPEAKQFDRWVRHEVLPQIMDNGGYVMKDADIEEVAEAIYTRIIIGQRLASVRGPGEPQAFNI